MEKDRIGILCGGGKAPGWPAGIKAATKMAEVYGFEPVGIEDGAEGLVVPDAVYRHIREYGDQRDFLFSNASPICSSRYTPFNKKKMNGESDAERDARALQEFLSSKTKGILEDNMRRNRIKFIIALGGDDTIWTMQQLIAAGVIEGNVSPKTVDNDVTGTLTFGHLTAGHVGRQMVDGILIEAMTYGRVGLVESMGRYGTYLPQQHYNAEIILPAHEFEIPRAQVVERIKQVFRENGRRERGNPNKGHAVVVVPEGFLIDGKETFISTTEDHHGHKKLGGVGHRLEDWMEDEGLKTTYQRPGYLYRFTPPIPEDAMLSYKLAAMATEQAIKGNTGISAVARGRMKEIGWRNLKEIHGGKVMTAEEYDFDRLKPKSKEPRAE